ncbi:MAG: ABC transporter ATP-binding protein [Patescibacteria group bacterium UBA2103]
MKVSSNPIKFMLFAVRKYLWLFIAATAFVILIEILGGIATIGLQRLIDSANLYVEDKVPLSTVFFWLMVIPIARLFYALLIRVSNYIMHYLTVHARTDISRFLFGYLSDHSLGYFSDRFAGSLGSRVNTISQSSMRLLGQFLWMIVSNFSTIVINLALIVSVNLKLGLFMIGSLFVLIPINFFLTRKQINLSEKMVETGAKLRGELIDAVSNIIPIQQFARRDHELKRLDKYIFEHRDAEIKSDYYTETVLLINNIIAASIGIAAALWSFNLWSQELITLGSFILVVGILGHLMWSFTFVGQWLNNIMESYGEMRDGLKEIIVPHDVVDAPDAKELSASEGEIVFSDVSFEYKDAKDKIFDDVNLVIPANQKVGIVGRSGAGKTTLMKLLLRQYDLTSGSISLDGQNVKDVTLESLRSHIAIVPQEPILFHRSIKENILYGDINASEEQMIEVAKRAQAHDFIDALKEKYGSMVGERGVKLSVGQRQRIAIARAFLKDAPILILDEATSALDSESEVAVQKALSNLMEGKTVLAIAHRLSTLREMDRILVFDDGNIVEDGSHEELVGKGGVYASLWEHQAGGFLKEE